MPFAPAVQYRGDQYAFQGITGAGKGLEDLIRKQEELQTTGSYNDAIVEHAKQNGLIDQEEYNKYLGASHTQKTGIAAGIAANIAQDWRRQQTEEAATRHTQDMEQRERLASLPYEFAPSAEDMTRARSAGGELLPIGRGQFTFKEYPESAGTNGQIQVDPFVDPLTQKPVPGMGIVRKTGQIGYFGSLLGAGGGVPIETDQATGMKFYRDAKGNPKPLDPTKVLSSTLTQGMNGGAAPAAQPTPAPSAAPTAPQVGEVRKGYRFKGGDPAKQENWEKAL